MITQKEHKKATLMRWSKEELAEHIMMLEHNINALKERSEGKDSNGNVICSAELWEQIASIIEGIPKERDVDKPKITCLNCKHLMFSDMYGECNKQLRIVNPSDTCEYAEPKERGGEK